MDTPTEALKYAHEIVPHPEEGEVRPLEVTVRYHYAQAQAWHLAFADTLAKPYGAESDFALSRYLGHAHLALLHDALAQGLSGQAATDWASSHNHSESAEVVWERGAAYGLDPDLIRPYSTERRDASAPTDGPSDV